MARDLVVRIVGDSKSLERSLERSEKATRRFGQQTDRTFRGVVAGSGAFRSLGRSVAFASSAFLGGVGLSAAIRSSIAAAQDQLKTNRALAAQFQAAGLDAAKYTARVNAAADALGELGIQDDEAIKAFTTLFRASGNVSGSLKNLGLVADIAAARNIDLQKAALLVGKILTGNTQVLSRYGVSVGKGATVTEALEAATAKFAGQARAAVTPQERFAVALDRTQEIIGFALLPILTRYLDKLSVWLDRMNRSGELQRRVNRVMESLAKILPRLEHGLSITADAVGKIRDAFGGWDNAIKTLGLLVLLSKLNKTIGKPGAGRRGGGGGSGLLGMAALVTGLPGVLTIAAASGVNASDKLSSGFNFVYKKVSNVNKAIGEFIGFDMPDVAKNATKEVLNLANAFTTVGKAIQDAAKNTAGAFDATSKRGRDRGVNLAPFQLPFSLQLKQAQAAATKARRDDVSVAKQVKAFAQAIIASVQPLVESGQVQGKALKTLREKLLDAYSALADANSTLADAASKSAKKALEAANEQRKTLAANIKSAVLERLRARQTDILNRRALVDAQEQLRLAKKLGGPQGIRAAQRNIQDVRFDMLTARLERAPATLSPAGRFAFGGVVININGVTDPDAVARKVEAILRRRQRHTSSPMRGPAAGATA